MVFLYSMALRNMIIREYNKMKKSIIEENALKRKKKFEIVELDGLLPDLSKKPNDKETKPLAVWIKE